MENTQILTYDLFKNRISAAYEKAINKEDSKLEDNLETFAEYIKRAFDVLNIEQEIDAEKLYSLYFYTIEKVSVDFSNIAQLSKQYYTFLNIVQGAGLDIADNFESFKLFASETVEGEKLSEETLNAVYTLFKLHNTDKDYSIQAQEQEELKKALTNKKENLNLRKMHRIRDAFLKKGGTLAAVVGGAAIGTLASFAFIPAQFVAARAITNILAFAVDGAIVGAGLTFAGIKIKNAITKTYYKKKYNAKVKDIDALENGDIKVDDLRICKLIEKTSAVNAEILRLKQELPATKNVFGKIKNTFVGFGRKVKRHALNIVNRNRIHTISDELDIINARIKNLLNSEDEQKAIKIANLQALRERIATVRAEELMNAMAQAAVSSKRQKIENLDIYAKDLLSSKDRKSSKAVRAKALEILFGKTDEEGNVVSTGLINGDITTLAGGYITDSENNVYSDCNIKLDIPVVVEPEEEVTAEEIVEEVDTLSNAKDAIIEFAKTYITDPRFLAYSDTSLHELFPNRSKEEIYSLQLEILNKVDTIMEENPQASTEEVLDIFKDVLYPAPVETPAEPVVEETEEEVVAEDSSEVNSEEVTPVAEEPVEEIAETVEPVAPIATAVEEDSLSRIFNTADPTKPTDTFNPDTTLIGQRISEMFPVEEEQTSTIPVGQMIKKMVTNFRVEPITKKGETVGKRLKVTRADGTKETYQFRGDLEDVDHMIAAAVRSEISM